MKQTDLKTARGILDCVRALTTEASEIGLTEAAGWLQIAALSLNDVLATKPGSAAGFDRPSLAAMSAD